MIRLPIRLLEVESLRFNVFLKKHQLIRCKLKQKLSESYRQFWLLIHAAVFFLVVFGSAFVIVYPSNASMPAGVPVMITGSGGRCLDVQWGNPSNGTPTSYGIAMVDLTNSGLWRAA